MENLSSIRRFLTLSNPYFFILLIGSAVGLAWIAPDAAASGGWLYPKIATKAAIFVIFILQGLSLPFDEIKDGLRQYRIHILIQSFIFFFIPALVWVGILMTGSILAFDLQMGFLFLAAVPTTYQLFSGVYSTSRRFNNRSPIQCLGIQCFGDFSGAPLGVLASGTKCGASAGGRHDC